MADLAKGSKKLLNAWAFYDWANSVYPLVISSAIFPIFFEALFSERSHYIEVFGMNLKNSALISFVKLHDPYLYHYNAICFLQPADHLLLAGMDLDKRL